MKTLQKIPFEFQDEIASNHIIVGAFIVEDGETPRTLARSIRENMFESTIHVLQKNTDGSIHNAAVLQACFEALNDFIDDVNELEKAIQEDLEQIPDVVGVYFTKPRHLATIFD